MREKEVLPIETLDSKSEGRAAEQFYIPEARIFLLKAIWQRLQDINPTITFVMFRRMIEAQIQAQGANHSKLWRLNYAISRESLLDFLHLLYQMPIDNHETVAECKRKLKEIEDRLKQYGPDNRAEQLGVYLRIKSRLAKSGID